MTEAAANGREAELTAHYGLCDEALRDQDRDCWLACLFAPAAERRHLHALYAFACEIADVRTRVTQPLLGEMRLRWWLDALATESGGAGGGARAHPVADALLDTVERCGLPRDEIAALIEAHSFDLYDDPMPTLAELETYCAKAVAAPLRWSAQSLGAVLDAETAKAMQDAGLALGLTKLLRALPRHAAAGQVYVPLDVLARHGASAQDVIERRATPGLQAALAELRALARAHYALARQAAPHLGAAQAALLPAAVAPLALDAMERRARNPFGEPPEPAQWRRQWRLWRAARGVGLC